MCACTESTDTVTGTLNVHVHTLHNATCIYASTCTCTLCVYVHVQPYIVYMYRRKINVFIN